MFCKYFLCFFSLTYVSLSSVIVPLYFEREQHDYKELNSEYLDRVEISDQRSDLPYGYITIGSQSFRVLFDSTSKHLWVPSVDADNKSCALHIHNMYDSSSSSTYNKATDKEYEIKYQSFAVSGAFASDTVSIGKLSLPNQNFLEVNSATGSFHLAEYDGIIGFVLNTTLSDDDGIESPFEAIFNKNLVESKIFSIYINVTQFKPQAGELIIGGHNKEKYHDDLRWIPVAKKEDNTYGLWTLKIDTGYYPRTDDFAKFCSDSLQPCKAVLDTSVSKIYGPAAIIDEIHNRWGVEKVPEYDDIDIWHVNCSTITRPNHLREFSFQFVDIEGNANTFFLESSNLFTKFFEYGRVYCVSNLVPVYSKTDWIFGLPFFKSFYVSFDFGERNVGIANKKY